MAVGEKAQNPKAGQVFLNVKLDCNFNEKINLRF